MTHAIRLDDENEAEIGSARWYTRDEYIDANGVRIPSRVRLHMPGDLRGPELHLTFRISNGVAACTELYLEAKGGKAIRAKDARDAARVLLDWSEDILEIFTKAHQTVRPPRARKITGQVLAQVAATYRRNLDRNPTRAVADHFGITRPTAGRWVTTARQAGLLPPTTPGKKRA
jgi:hypothetical protein